jgi:transposase
VPKTPPLQPDPTRAESVVAELRTENAGLRTDNEKLKAERDQFRRMYLEMLELARKLELGIVGRGREKDVGDTSPLSLLALMNGGAPAPEPAAEPEKQKVEAHERAKPTGRKPLPEKLPRVTIEVVPEEVQRAGLDAFERIGEDVSETVERRPAAVVVVRSVRGKYVPKGQARGDETEVLQGEPLELPIPRGLAGPGMLADTIVKRWADHTPLHRMERIYGRDGLELARQTVCDWHLALSKLVQPLVDAMWADALDSPYLCSDATGVLVQHPERCKRGHFFVVAAPEKHVLFAFSERHNAAAVDEILGAYKGVLVADAATVFDHLYAKGDVREAGCMAHARRYFFKALSTEPKRAREALAFFTELFDAERALKGAPPEDRKAQRARVHARILDRFEAWCDAESLKVVDEAPLAKAIGYARNQRAALRTFLSDGRLPMENNWSERELRRIAWGRDNWLFVGSEDGGTAAANFVSLIASCQLHGLEPYAYLRDLFCLLPWWPKSQVLDLAPARWKTTADQPDVQKTLAENVFRRITLGEIEPDPKR